MLSVDYSLIGVQSCPPHRAEEQSDDLSLRVSRLRRREDDAGLQREVDAQRTCDRQTSRPTG